MWRAWMRDSGCPVLCGLQGQHEPLSPLPAPPNFPGASFSSDLASLKHRELSGNMLGVHRFTRKVEQGTNLGSPPGHRQGLAEPLALVTVMSQVRGDPLAAPEDSGAFLRGPGETLCEGMGIRQLLGVCVCLSSPSPGGKDPRPQGAFLCHSGAVGASISVPASAYPWCWEQPAHGHPLQPPWASASSEHLCLDSAFTLNPGLKPTLDAGPSSGQPPSPGPQPEIRIRGHFPAGDLLSGGCRILATRSWKIGRRVRSRT